MAADHRTEGAATAAELRHTGGAVTRTAGALLLVHLLAGTPHVGAALRLMGAGLAFGELPVDAALDQVLARLEAKNLVGEFDRTRVLAFQRGDIQFHLTPLPARQPALRPEQQPLGHCRWRP